MRRAKDRALRQLLEEAGIGVASHQFGAVILDHRCHKGKRECLVPSCGAAKFLQQHEDFQWRPKSLAGDRMVRLFDRSSGRLARAADLPLPEDEHADAP